MASDASAFDTVSTAYPSSDNSDRAHDADDEAVLLQPLPVKYFSPLPDTNLEWSAEERDVRSYYPSPSPSPSASPNPHATAANGATRIVPQDTDPSATAASPRERSADPTQSCEICCEERAHALTCPQCHTVQCMQCIANRGSYPINRCFGCERNCTITIESARQLPDAAARQLLRPLLRDAAWVQTADANTMSSSEMHATLVGLQSVRVKRRRRARSDTDSDSGDADEHARGGAVDSDAESACVTRVRMLVVQEHERHARAVAEELALEMQSQCCHNCGLRVSIYDVDLNACMSLSCVCGARICAICGSCSPDVDASHDHVRLFHSETLFLSECEFYAAMLCRALALARAGCAFLDADPNFIWSRLRDLAINDIAQHYDRAIHKPGGFNVAHGELALLMAQQDDPDLKQVDEAGQAHLGALPLRVLERRPDAFAARSLATALRRCLEHPDTGTESAMFAFLAHGGMQSLAYIVRATAGSNVVSHQHTWELLQACAIVVTSIAETDAQLVHNVVPCEVLVALDDVLRSAPYPRPPTVGWISWSSLALRILSGSPQHARRILADFTVTLRILLRQGRLDAQESLCDDVGSSDLINTSLLQSAESDAEAVSFWFALGAPAHVSTEAQFRFARALMQALKAPVNVEAVRISVTAVLKTGALRATMQMVASDAVPEADRLEVYRGLMQHIRVVEREQRPVLLAELPEHVRLATCLKLSGIVLRKESAQLIKGASNEMLQQVHAFAPELDCELAFHLFMFPRRCQEVPLDVWVSLDGGCVKRAFQSAVAAMQGDGESKLSAWMVKLSPVVCALLQRGVAL